MAGWIGPVGAKRGRDAIAPPAILFLCACGSRADSLRERAALADRLAWEGELSVFVADGLGCGGE